jgi:hypothetical protein
MQFPNQLLNSTLPQIVPIGLSINDTKQTLSPFIPSNQNTSLTHNIPMNGIQRLQNEKDKSKYYDIINYLIIINYL